MLEKSNHGFKEKYPYVRVGTLEPMHIEAKTGFSPYASVLEYEYDTLWNKI